MKLCIFTIVLDGMPFIPAQFYTFNRLHLDWHWYVAEGAAANTGSTSWCRPQAPRLSNDGTTQFLKSISSNPRVTVATSDWWSGGKDEMVNYLISLIKTPCVLVEVDADEMWRAEQIELMYRLLAKREDWGALQFYCRYFVGPNIVTLGHDCYGNNPGEWLRAWTFQPGDRFERHEPPILCRQKPGKCVHRDFTRRHGLVFDHYAYAFEAQVAYKEHFYGYLGAVNQWRKLQANSKWPVKLKEYLPWVDDRAQADTLHKT